MPISWRGTLQQYVGRLHRLNENKKEVQVFDYADIQVPMLASSDVQKETGRLCGTRLQRCQQVDFLSKQPVT